jgi:hypothetical protein
VLKLLGLCFGCGTGTNTDGTHGEEDNGSQGPEEEEEEQEPCITPQEVQLYALSGLLHISMEPQASGLQWNCTIGESVTGMQKRGTVHNILHSTRVGA